MIIDHGARASGKTTRAVEWAAGNDKRVIVTPNEVVHVLRRAEALGVRVRVVSWRSYLNGALRGYRDIEVYLDEAGACLDSLGGHVVAASAL